MISRTKILILLLSFPVLCSSLLAQDQEKETIRVINLGGSGDPERQKERESTQYYKYVDGKYIIGRIASEKNPLWYVTTYDTSCSCYRSWMLQNGKIISVNIGMRINDTNTITWSSVYPDANKKHIDVSYQTVSEDRRSIHFRKRINISGKKIMKVGGTYTYQKPLPDETDEGDNKTRSY